ncbi:craniofacial development protein 1 isoform X2 [Corythoichthys intestinalis]|uniref:craniofacial development protein 1 isoform X2 n=1 Tax=Corythoichthys intestinalis TaxID=161448 RepID=UPI0025A63AB5|nr:craniofacial development protein 1 isoform X2 [Corythoichthys intestinalis]XP_061812330.1 craniofacial development protein 1-like [Nerophis lumbriciformis]
MNYSDDDSDSYLSSEDADYVPSDDNASEDDINECEKEDPLDESDVPHPNMTKRTAKKKDCSSRKRSKLVLKVDDAEKKGEAAKEAEPLQDAVENMAQIENNDEAAEKKQSDDLWARFLSDVAPRPKPSMDSHTTLEAHSSDSNVCTRTESKESDPAKVTIVKVFDFAGEEVRVNKEVSLDSREAKMHLKVQCTKEKMGKENPTSSPPQSTCPEPSSKRPAGMSSLLSRIGGKKQKMSTLEKSKIDWDAFKYEEGIAEELAIHNRGKDGYVERKNFLERVDHRQFEMEKEVRLKNMKPST